MSTELTTSPSTEQQPAALIMSGKIKLMLPAFA